MLCQKSDAKAIHCWCPRRRRRCFRSVNFESHLKCFHNAFYEQEKVRFDAKSSTSIEKKSMDHKSSTSIRFHFIRLDLISNLEDGKGFSAPFTATQSLHTHVQQRRHSRGKKNCIQRANACDESTSKEKFIFLSIFSYLGLHYL